MRIAMLAPLYESVPPRRYGGTERVIFYLTEELVRRGHAVTLFAAGGSQTSGELVEVCPGPLAEIERSADPLAYHFLQAGLAIQRSSEFDLIHSHCDFRLVPLAHRLPVPLLSTSHNRLDTDEARAMARAFPGFPATALSACHRRQLDGPRWVGECYNGIPVEEFPFSGEPGHYLAFLGRLSPEKGPVEAIEVAKRSGVPLKIAAKINPWERDYFEAEIRPRLDPPLVQYIGELGEDEKRPFLRDALALVFPIAWPEPFGMVMIEAMACGTPVLAFPRGAAPEIVDHGETGFLCTDVSVMVAQVGRLANLDRAACRTYVGERFSAAAMATAYEGAYARALAGPASETKPLLRDAARREIEALLPM